jgi:hypothetical protein
MKVRCEERGSTMALTEVAFSALLLCYDGSLSRSFFYRELYLQRQNRITIAIGIVGLNTSWLR